MKLSLLLSIFLYFHMAPLGYAESLATNLRQQALKEIKTPNHTYHSIKSIENSIGMLKLEETSTELKARTSEYFFGLKAQMFRPRGTVTNNSAGPINLDRAAETLMPGISMGILSSKIDSFWNLSWQIGVGGEISISSQNTKTTFASGFSTNDCQLNSNILAIGPLLTMHIRNAHLNHIPSITLNPQIGTLNYTQSSSNEFARFSKAASFLGANLDVIVPIQKGYSLYLEYSKRNLIDPATELAIQQENFSLGAKVTWQ